MQGLCWSRACCMKWQHMISMRCETTEDVMIRCSPGWQAGGTWNLSSTLVRGMRTLRTAAVTIRCGSPRMTCTRLRTRRSCSLTPLRPSEAGFQAERACGIALDSADPDACICNNRCCFLCCCRSLPLCPSLYVCYCCGPPPTPPLLFLLLWVIVQHGVDEAYRNCPRLV